MSPLFGIFHRGLLVQRRLLLVKRLTSVPHKNGHVGPSISSKKDLSVVTSPVTTERGRVSFFCRDGYFFFFFCAYIVPFLVKGFWEFLHFLIFIFWLNLIFFLFLFLTYQALNFMKCKLSGPFWSMSGFTSGLLLLICSLSRGKRKLFITVLDWFLASSERLFFVWWNIVVFGISWKTVLVW